MEKTEIRSLLEFQFVSNPGFSPDGRLAAYVVQHGEICIYWMLTVRRPIG